MSKYDNEKLLSFLNERWKGRGCPMCGQGPWSAQDKVFQLTEFHDGGMVIGGPLIPVIPVTCNNCGYTALVNAIYSGTVQPASTGGESDKGAQTPVQQDVGTQK